MPTPVMKLDERDLQQAVSMWIDKGCPTWDTNPPALTIHMTNDSVTVYAYPE